MNEQNFEHLEKNVKYQGFGEGLSDAMRKAIEAGSQTFSLPYATQFNDAKFEATLHFKRSEQSDHYFFNSYDAKMINETGTREQTIYLDKGKGFTAKEAFNLLEGRAVYKELTNKQGEKYHAWCQLEFGKKDQYNNFELKRYTDNYGFDLSKTLTELGIAKAGTEELSRMMKSLEKGNQVSHSLQSNGSTRTVYIEANPMFKKLEWYHADRSVMDKQQREQTVKEVKEQNLATGHSTAQNKEKAKSKEQEPEKLNTGLQQKQAKGRSVSR